MLRVVGAVVAAAAVGLVIAGTSIAGDEPRIAFPADYATKFKNYVSLDRTQNDDQTIRLFGNDKALEAARAGKELPDGSVLVAEIYKAKKDAKGEVIESSLGRRIRDKFAAIAVMEKRKGWGDKFPAEFKNGDWDFAIFSPKGERLVDKDLNSCRGCHAPLTDTQHLFSLEHMAGQ